MARPNRNNRSVHSDSPKQNKPTDGISTETDTTKANEPVETAKVDAPVSEDTTVSQTETAQVEITEVEASKKPEYTHELELAIVDFIEATKLDKILTPEEIANHQFSLLSKIKGIFNAKDQGEFNKKFNTVLSFFNKNKDVKEISLMFVFRHPYAWPGSQLEYNQFRRIMYLIIETCDPKTRKSKIENIVLDKVTEGLTEKQKTFLANFYE